VGDGLAVQIEPNPNPDGNTITITPSTPRENLVPFTNVGTINIEPLASFQNSNQFNNGILLPFTPGGAVINSGTIINSDQFNNYRRVSILEGSRFINLPSAFYYNGGGVTQINGIFINEGAAEHNSNGFAVSETGQYIQRQAVGSSVVPTTVNRDMVFRNAGQVSITAGEFINRPFGIYAQTGTTQIDAVFLNDGRVFNDGRITVGTSGLYEHQNENAFPGPGPNPGGLTSNTGIFANAGTTNIATGVFTNQASVANSGTFTVGTTGTYSQTSTSAGVTSATVNTGTFVSAGQVRIGEGTKFSNGTFINPGTTTINAGVFENNGDFRNNAGQVRIGEGALFSNTRNTPLGMDTVSGLYLQEVGGRTRIDGGFDNRGSVSNEGTIAVGTTGTYAGGGTRNAGIFQNEGRVSLSAPSSFFNTGQYIQLASGKTEIGGMFVNFSRQMSNAGAITVGTTGQYVQDLFPGSKMPALSTTLNTGTFTNAGMVRIGEGTSFSNFPRLEHGSPPPVGGHYIQQSGGTTQIDGSFSSFGGRVTNEGAITVGATGTYGQTRSGAPVPGIATTISTGSFTNAGRTVINGGTFTNHGTVVNSGTWQIAPNGTGTFVNQGSTMNTGTFEVAARGQVTGTGSYAQTAAAAQTIVNGTFAHNVALQAGALSGVGTITGTVTNTGGVVQPGSLVQPGVLTLTNYVQGPSGRLDLKLGGLLAGSHYDVLRVTGSGIFGGSLSLRLINGFTPGLGHRFDLLTCSLGCSGSNGGSLFSGGLLLPSLASGLSWGGELTNGGTVFSYTVIASAASAPEPGTLLLVGSGFAGLVAWKQRRRERAV
ncbi:MAG: PEP-CTERM sorting domain-containing protein, partial [Nitrospira sp.]|nr:PEP-CTERM sorting domain-containing protein [Nitrospira sp.]